MIFSFDICHFQGELNLGGSKNRFVNYSLNGKTEYNRDKESEKK